MSARDRRDDEPLHDEGFGQEDEILERPEWARNMPWWAASAFLHLVLIAIIGAIVISSTEEENVILRDPPTVRIPKPPKYDPIKPKDVKREPKILTKPIEEKLVVEQKIDKVEVEIPAGTEHLRADSHQNSEFTNIDIGVGGGGAGLYGLRGVGDPGGHVGAPRATEDAVLAALWWLHRHQHPDGGWRAAGFDEHAEGPGCSNHDTSRYPKDEGDPAHDIGVTGLAILAYTGYGITHRLSPIPELQETVARAINYLRDQQIRSEDPMLDGRYGPGKADEWAYDHSIATLAMAEALLLSGDHIRLRNSVERATKLCLRMQNPGRGWRYGFQDGENDTSVTGWMVLALKTSQLCNLRIPKESYRSAFAGARDWFTYATASNGQVGYSVPGDQGSQLAGVHPEPYPFSKEPSCMTAVGVLCRLFAGESRRDPEIRRGVDRLAAHPPKWREQKGRSLSSVNVYYWYYGAYAMFQFGGRPWIDWNDAMQTALLSSQRSVDRGDSEEVDGSWDPIGEWGVSGGRVYATALGAMTLEVYYRYRRQQGENKS